MKPGLLTSVGNNEHSDNLRLTHKSRYARTGKPDRFALA